MTQAQDLLVKEKPAKAVLSLRKHRLSRSEEMYVSEVSRQIDSTFAHTVKIVSKLEKHGLVESERKGRKKLLELTEKGERYADNLQELMSDHAVA